MNTLEIMEPLSIFYCFNGSIISAMPYESNNSKYKIDQRCKERVFLSKGKRPLLYINWLITPKCNYDCIYCYAKDVMQCTQEPHFDTLMNTAKSILKFDPIVVTLSGGEPFLSPHLEDIILFLEGKIRIIVDTNGSITNNSLLQTIKEKDVLLRVSLDDIDSRRNNKTRWNVCGGVQQTIDFIKHSIQIGIDVVVQTVVTKVNIDHLSEIYEYLLGIGVKHWRLLPVSSLDLGTSFLKCTPQEIYSLKETLCNNMDMDIAIQKEYDMERAGIVLVSPEGTFLTINKEGKKVCIDPNNPFNPNVEIFNKAVDWDAHLLRYIDKQEERE